jgi:mannose-6-phosphate isomerase-like protein (cupin superfamily)
MLIPNESEIAARAINVVPKLWGVEFWLVNTKKYCWKLLKINPGFVSSIHSHAKKDETFYGIMGMVRLDIHDTMRDTTTAVIINPGAQFEIKHGTMHSFRAVNTAWISEISTHHDDKDVIRLQSSRKLEP